MSEFRPNDPLLLAGKILTIIVQAAMAIAAVAMIVAIPILLFARGAIDSEMGAKYGAAIDAFPTLPVIGIILLGIAIVAMIFLFFGKLRQIIATVGEGDPFAPANADRLSLMAWLMLGVQLLSLPMAGLVIFLLNWIEQLKELGEDIDAHISLNGGLDLESILMIVVLFILARVFRHGAAMREDLAGTV